MLTEFECKDCGWIYRQHCTDLPEEWTTTCECETCGRRVEGRKVPPPPPPPLRNVRNDIRPELPPTVEYVRRSHRLELVWLPLAAMVAGFIGGVLASHPQWWAL